MSKENYQTLYNSKRVIHQENIATLSVYVPYSRAINYMKQNDKRPVRREKMNPQI